MFRQQKGFTLIELLVVVVIIGVIAALAMAALSRGPQKARDSHRMNDIKTIQTGLELYLGEKNQYPVGTDIKLGREGAKALTSSGFVDTPASGDTVFLGIIPAHINPPSGDFVYNGTAGTYTITFLLEGKLGDIEPGLKTASPGSIN